MNLLRRERNTISVWTESEILELLIGVVGTAY